MRMITAAAVQMKCCDDVKKNIEHGERLVRQAAEEGANVILLPELFERPYFCMTFMIMQNRQRRTRR